MSWRRRNLPGYSSIRQIALLAERRASIQNRPVSGSATNATAPAVARASINA